MDPLSPLDLPTAAGAGVPGVPGVGGCGLIFGELCTLSSGAGRSLLDLLDPIVLLLISFCGVSEMLKLGIVGLLACATANGPANLGSIGTAIAPASKLARTVTGSTFSFNRSFFFVSTPPNTIRWTLLWIRRHT